MSRNTYISVAICLAGSIALFGWMFGSAPVQTNARLAVTKATAATPDEKKPAVKPTVKPTVIPIFSASRSTATALNEEPVNIVINPAVQPVRVDPARTNSADLVVISSGLRMRSEPSSRSDTLGNYARGAKFVLIRDQNGWVLVQSLDDGQKGWMFRKFMAKEG